MQYNDLTELHFDAPHNIGLWADARNIGTGRAGTQGVSDVIQVQIRVAKGAIKKACFKCYGSVYSIAACSLATELLKEKSLQDAAEINAQRLTEELEIPYQRSHCAVLVEDAIQAAIKDYEDKRGVKDE